MLTANLIVAALLAADPLPEAPPQLTFLELKVLIEGDGRNGSPVIPAQLKAHLDRKVRLRGYINPFSVPYDTTDRFVLYPDNTYEGPIDARQNVLVVLKKAIEFTTARITVEGTFRHREVKNEGVVLACLAIDDAEVIADKPEAGIRDLLKTFRDEFVQIAPGQGKFPAEVTIGEGQTRKIKLSPEQFYIAKYEVPQNLWEAVMGENPSKWKGKRNSVEMLDFEAAQAFCVKVTRYLREARLISENQVVRLPSEAEWEYCARAGTTTRFSFGDEIAKLDDYAWSTQNAKDNDPPVGAKLPNAWGLYDAHGYLWEWCTDAWTDDVTKLPANGKPYAAGTDEAAQFGVLRGGSWKDKAELLSSGYRRRAERTLADDAVGLRCVLAVEGDR